MVYSGSKVPRRQELVLSARGSFDVLVAVAVKLSDNLTMEHDFEPQIVWRLTN